MARAPRIVGPVTLAALALPGLVLGPACARTRTQKVEVHRYPGEARLFVRPSVPVEDRRPASETVTLRYRTTDRGRTALVVGGIGGILAGVVGLLVGVVAESIESNGLVFPADPEDDGAVGEAILIGSGILLAAGIASVAVGASREPRVIPETYAFEARAEGYLPLRREVVAPRETVEPLELRLVPTATGTVF